jgi:hypothetical protein
MFAAHTIAKRFGSAMALYKDRVKHSEESVETDATFWRTGPLGQNVV